MFVTRSNHVNARSASVPPPRIIRLPAYFPLFRTGWNRSRLRYAKVRLGSLGERIRGYSHFRKFPVFHLMKFSKFTTRVAWIWISHLLIESLHLTYYSNMNIIKTNFVVENTRDWFRSSSSFELFEYIWIAAKPNWKDISSQII